MSTQYTFWKLLDRCSIEIPIIQRDYAQGRNNKKAQDIRNNFVGTLFDILVSADEKTQDLDFVYGKIHDNILILLDGQQRLTTLFLLHWYIALRNKKLEEVKQKLQKFSYKTRITAREFCTTLVEKGSQLGETKENNFSDLIKDQPWYFSFWNHDPTIQSMLTMLDSLHAKFSQHETSLWERLVDSNNPPITFHFLNMEQLKLTDALYIKMNARGRSLTEFENFKAWLQRYIDTKPIQFKDSEAFWQNIDKNWTDIFWALHGIKSNNKVYTFDELYLRFFKNIALLELITKISFSSEKLSDQDHKQHIEQLRKSSTADVDYHEKHETFNADVLNKLSLTLNTIHKLKGSNDQIKAEVESIFKESLTKPDDINLLKLHALIIFISECNLSQTIHFNVSDALRAWLRVSKNLIINRNYESINNDFIKAAKSLTKLSKSSLEIYQKRELIDQSLHFNTIQIEEEKVKSSLIIDDPAWENAFIKYENHSYFFGQVSFLIDFSKDGAQTPQLDKFHEYAEKAEAIFTENKENPIRKEYLLERALLKKYNYLRKQGHTSNDYRFLDWRNESFRSLNEGWRTVFNNEKERHHLKALLDGIRPEHEEKDLRSIIETSNTNDWRDYFSSTHETFRFCTDKRIRQHWEQKNRFDLLYKARITEKDGYFAELRSYVLYHNLKNNSCFTAQNIVIDYKYGKQNDWATHVILKKPEEKYLFICYDYTEDQFRCFHDSEHKNETEHQDQNTLINIEKTTDHLYSLLFHPIQS